MSLVAFGIRIATVRAIRAALWSEFVVVDSPQKPLPLLEAGKPFVAVYTGHDTDKMEGRELFAGDPHVTLTIQIFLPATFTVSVAGQTLTLDTRAEGAETVLDVVARRILAAFLQECEPWSRLWAEFVQTTHRSQNISYLVEAKDVRTSARELTLECGVLYEPTPGAPPDGVWARLIELMRAEPLGPGSVAPLADWLAAEISGPTTLCQGDRDRIDLGLSVYPAPPSATRPRRCDGAQSGAAIAADVAVGLATVTVDGRSDPPLIVSADSP